MRRHGPLDRRQWSAWTVKAVLASGGVIGIGILLLGIPGGIVLELVRALGLARRLGPDDAWPLAILLTFLGGLFVIPASLALRHQRPGTTGWNHVWLTALATLAATFMLALILVR